MLPCDCSGYLPQLHVFTWLFLAFVALQVQIYTVKVSLLWEHVDCRDGQFQRDHTSAWKTQTHVLEGQPYTSLGEGVRESSAVSKQKSVGGTSEFKARLGVNTNSVPSFHFQFDCENNWINDNREECAQSTHSKHSASKEIIKNYHVYLSHSSKYVDESGI